MKIGLKLLAQFQPQVVTLCLLHQVEHLYAFGSVLTDDFDINGKSDLDFLVLINRSLPPLDKGEQLLQFWNELEQLFHRPVDLVSESALKNPYLIKEINQTKVLLYDRESLKISV